MPICFGSRCEHCRTNMGWEYGIKGSEDTRCVLNLSTSSFRLSFHCSDL